jgi:hypothetical protein
VVIGVSSLPQFRQQRMRDKNAMKQVFVISMIGIQGAPVGVRIDGARPSLARNPHQNSTKVTDFKKI